MNDFFVTFLTVTTCCSITSGKIDLGEDTYLLDCSTMTFLTELQSLLVAASFQTAGAPVLGSRAPSTEVLELPEPAGRPVIITFLRHCGCPCASYRSTSACIHLISTGFFFVIRVVAEKSFRKLHETAKSRTDVAFIAVSHSSSAHTTVWIDSLALTNSELPNLRIIVDESCSLYGTWGLGSSSFLHWMSPSSLWSAVKMGREEGIWNRPTESGSRWQMSGSWAVDGEGIAKWGGPSKRADDEDVWKFEEALKALNA